MLDTVVRVNRYTQIQCIRHVYRYSARYRADTALPVTAENVVV